MSANTFDGKSLLTLKDYLNLKGTAASVCGGDEVIEYELDPRRHPRLSSPFFTHLRDRFPSAFRRRTSVSSVSSSETLSVFGSKHSVASLAFASNSGPNNTSHGSSAVLWQSCNDHQLRVCCCHCDCRRGSLRPMSATASDIWRDATSSVSPAFCDVGRPISASSLSRQASVGSQGSDLSLQERLLQNLQSFRTLNSKETFILEEIKSRRSRVDAIWQQTIAETSGGTICTYDHIKQQTFDVFPAQETSFDIKRSNSETTDIPSKCEKATASSHSRLPVPNGNLKNQICHSQMLLEDFNSEKNEGSILHMAAPSSVQTATAEISCTIKDLQGRYSVDAKVTRMNDLCGNNSHKLNDSQGRDHGKWKAFQSKDSKAVTALGTYQITKPEVNVERYQLMASRLPVATGRNGAATSSRAPKLRRLRSSTSVSEAAGSPSDSTGCGGINSSLPDLSTFGSGRTVTPESISDGSQNKFFKPKNSCKEGAKEGITIIRLFCEKRGQIL